MAAEFCHMRGLDHGRLRLFTFESAQLIVAIVHRLSRLKSVNLLVYCDLLVEPMHI